MAKYEEDVLEKFKRRVASTEQKARECLSLLKFSEGLVKRDINIVRIQIDLRLKKLERKALDELEELFSTEKEHIEELLTNLRFFSKRANSSPSEGNIAEIEQELRKESNNIYRKRFIFDTNKDLDITLDKLGTFGRTLVKKIDENQMDITNSSDDKIDTLSVTQEITECKDAGNIGGDSFDICRERKLDTNKDTDMFAETDPFDILRSMKTGISKNGINSCKNNFRYRKNMDRTKNIHLQPSKHVKFADELDEKEKISYKTGTGKGNESLLSQRGRLVTDCERKRRARSTSPRAVHFNSNTKRDKMQGILKHITKLTNDIQLVCYDSDITSVSADIPDVARQPCESFLHQDDLDRIPFGKTLENKDTKAKINEYGRTVTKRSLETKCDDREHLIQDTFIEPSALSNQLNEENTNSSADNTSISNNDYKSSIWSYKQNRLSMDNNTTQRQLKLKEKRKRNRSLSTDINKVITEARNQCDDSKIISKSDRLRLPSFDDMLYRKH